MDEKEREERIKREMDRGNKLLGGYTTNLNFENGIFRKTKKYDLSEKDNMESRIRDREIER